MHIGPRWYKKENSRNELYIYFFFLTFEKETLLGIKLRELHFKVSVKLFDALFMFEFLIVCISKPTVALSFNFMKEKSVLVKLKIV